MIGDDTDGNILLLILMVNGVCNLTNMIGQRTQRIDIENGIYILNGYGQSLKTHTSINVFLNQIGIMTMSIVVKL